MYIVELWFVLYIIVVRTYYVWKKVGIIAITKDPAFHFSGFKSSIEVHSQVVEE